MLPLPARLTHREAAATLAQLQTALSEQPAGQALVIDAAPLQHFDSSALVVLLGLQRDAAGRGVDCRLHAVPARLQQLAQVYGVLGLVGLGSAPAGAQAGALASPLLPAPPAQPAVPPSPGQPGLT